MHAGNSPGLKPDTNIPSEQQSDVYITMRSCGLAQEYYITAHPVSYGQHESSWIQKYLVCPEHVFLFDEKSDLDFNAAYVHPLTAGKNCCAYITIRGTPRESLKKILERLYTITYHQSCPWCDGIRTPDEQQEECGYLQTLDELARII